MCGCPRLARDNFACRTEVACSHVSGLFTHWLDCWPPWSQRTEASSLERDMWLFLGMLWRDTSKARLRDTAKLYTAALRARPARFLPMPWSACARQYRRPSPSADRASPRRSHLFEHCLDQASCTKPKKLWAWYSQRMRIPALPLNPGEEALEEPTSHVAA